MESKQKLIVILGPTAVDKSLAAVRVAETLGSEIISADSRQIYLGMDIATAKPGPEILARVPHHLIDIVRPDEVFSAGQYREMARQIILQLYQQGKIPVLVGGTGLYIRALLHGLWPGPRAHWNLRSRLVQEERSAGPGYLHQKLAKLDPEAALRIHPHDEVKTIRALEVALLTGIPLTQHHKKQKEAGDHWRVVSGQNLTTGHTVVIGLRREREDLYQRINHRVDEMVRSGLVGEVEHLLSLGYREDLPSMRGLGYRQMVGYLRGLYSLQEAIRLIKRDTRRYAKRQMTWFRKEPHVQWIDLKPEDQTQQVAEKVLARIQSVKYDTPSLTVRCQLFWDTGTSH
jgi:tRNA dimethylallyltransferase